MGGCSWLRFGVGYTFGIDFILDLNLDFNFDLDFNNDDGIGYGLSDGNWKIWLRSLYKTIKQ